MNIARKKGFFSVRPWMSFALSVGVAFSFSLQLALAGTLTSAHDTLSTDYVTAIATHTLSFTAATTASIDKVSFQFSTTSGGSTKPASMDLSGATLGTVNNLGSGWSIDTSSASTGLLAITNSSAQSFSASTAASVALQNITDSDLGECTSTGELYDICYVSITTYAGASPIDDAITPYQLIEDPTLTFEVSPVSSGVTTNGITTSVTSTTTGISFGRLEADQVKYAAQQIRVKTNAPHGYAVSAFLQQNIQGINTNNEISPFGATNATWSTPQAWTTPTGSTANSNTGWIGANTTDTRISGWNGTTTGLFGPFSTTRHTVAYSSGPDVSGTLVTVSFVLGVNAAQPADTYTGNIIYDVKAVF